MGLALIAVIIIIAGTLFENGKLSISIIAIGMSLFFISSICVHTEYQGKNSLDTEIENNTETSIRTDDATGIQYISNSIFVMADENLSKEVIAPQIERIAGVPASVTDMQYGVFHVILQCEDKTLKELELLSCQLFSIEGVRSAAVDIYYTK